MALSATLVFEVRQTGSDTNGGAFRGGANMAAPAAPTATATAGGAVSAATYFVVITINDGNGESQKSAQASVTTAGGNLTITVTDPTTAVGQTYLVYVATVTGGPYWLNSATATAHGTNAAIAATPPTSGVQAPGVDYSQSDTPQVTVNNTTITATTAGANSNVLTFVGYVPTAADVGNTFTPSAGTNVNLNVPYEIVAWTATTWTVAGTANFTTAGGAGSAIVGKMGGAYANFATANTNGASNNFVFLKYNATPYTIGASTTPKGSVAGYDTTRTRNNLDANRPTLNCSANSIAPVITNAGSNNTLRNIIVAANAHTGITGFDSGSASDFVRCKATGVATGFNPSNGNVRLILCQADQCTTAGFSSSGNSCTFIACVATATTGHGFTATSTQLNTFIGCYAVNSTSSGHGFNLGGNRQTCYGCVAYHNAGSGFNVASSGPTAELTNCLSVANTAWGFIDNSAGVVQSDWLETCAAQGNGSGDYSGYLQARLVNFVSLSVDPFTNAAGLDFSLNSTAGGGAALAGVGIPGSTTGLTLPGLATLSYPSIGGAQPTGGGSAGSSSHNLVL